MERLVFDIGCFYGEWIEANFREDTLFVGFDGNLAACEIAREKFKDKDNVKILNVLISDEIGSADFYITEGVGGSTASLKWIEDSRHINTVYNNPIKVETTTLDILINVFGIPDYIKIDVEGYELKVIKGLTKKVGMIAYEWAEEFKDETIVAAYHLNGLGYEEFNWISGDDYLHIPQKWMRFNNFINIMKKELDPDRKQGWGMIYTR